MHKNEQDFYQVFTDLQCFILANMNKGNIHGVTATHYNIIEYVYRNRPTTGRQLALSFNISQAAVSKQLKFLTENKLIVQEQSDADRRIFYLGVTDAGKYIIENSENFRQRIAKKVAQSLTNDELETLTTLLHQVMHQIKE
ncbi:MarR family transcriptional regulator [Sphingobacterium sp. N143]|uniref:MarR family winged helix-turn-helix transcriptional regulator n=1 Tax=Sphingobacterium sp. N143 TaxID=2746727 RepID=UPI0025773AF6|nr:MarR family transcriptional regulator [Sphingobacterium sp. N143]MDM1295719.1 MarR family transcriptional regulator [Sphingobacterium sp. N143]